MRLSRRLTGVLLVLVLAGALAPGALAGKRNPPSTPAGPSAPDEVARGSASTFKVNIDALKG